MSCFAFHTHQFGMIWRWVNERIFIFIWTIPLKVCYWRPWKTKMKEKLCFVHLTKDFFCIILRPSVVMETFDCRWKKVFTDSEFSWSWNFDHEISESYWCSNLLPFNSHYSYFGSDPESKAFLWQTFEQHYAFHLHTNVRPHRRFCIDLAEG